MSNTEDEFNRQKSSVSVSKTQKKVGPFSDPSRPSILERLRG